MVDICNTTKKAYNLGNKKAAKNAGGDSSAPEGQAVHAILAAPVVSFIIR